jgi:hypothetical protein
MCFACCFRLPAALKDAAGEHRLFIMLAVCIPHPFVLWFLIASAGAGEVTDPDSLPAALKDAAGVYECAMCLLQCHCTHAMAVRCLFVQAFCSSIHMKPCDGKQQQLLARGPAPTPCPHDLVHKTLLACLLS